MPHAPMETPTPIFRQSLPLYRVTVVSLCGQEYIEICWLAKGPRLLTLASPCSSNLRVYQGCRLSISAIEREKA